MATIRTCIEKESGSNLGLLLNLVQKVLYFSHVLVANAEMVVSNRSRLPFTKFLHSNTGWSAQSFQANGRILTYNRPQQFLATCCQLRHS